ncbi:TetR family transcriptional regulator [Actinosynnema sp. NPDC047251]|uniref:Transcriptional regulator n=1 Tax=Saccharothrix espanaensis (strain ATCC 51144 / DSM 44229 / JCM 9112 / NBRC 15066 / NRRL 15764) TaxID=1179773 RepID=K0KC07_SACES|nr:TetR/AcrR family transcriptional regulator [Saccharothrix espanaensis]CCH35067.1 Transcriptional regulator [Saccharothrix espanaensis DSM 44229]
MTRPAETRQRIIAAVLRIIGDDGVAGVTNRRIAQQAGVSLGSVTYHFATQQDLLRESLLHFVSEETRHIGELARRTEGEFADLRQVVRLVGEVAGAMPPDSERIAPYELYLHAGRDPELRTAAAECFAAYDRLAATVLTALGVAEPEKVASAVVGLVMGLKLRALATGSDAEHLVDALLMLTRGAEPAGGAGSAAGEPVRPAGEPG